MLLFFYRILEDPGIWEVLTSLPTEWETASTQIITDPRIQANGLGIRMCTGKKTIVTIT